MLKVYKTLKFVSIHDVLTPRADRSDPTNAVDRGVQPAPLPLQQQKNQTPTKPPRGRAVPAAPNLRFVSIHDVLTPRDQNSDPTNKQDKK